MKQMSLHEVQNALDVRAKHVRFTCEAHVVNTNGCNGCIVVCLHAVYCSGYVCCQQGFVYYFHHAQTLYGL